MIFVILIVITIIMIIIMITIVMMVVFNDDTITSTNSDDNRDDYDNDDNNNDNNIYNNNNNNNNDKNNSNSNDIIIQYTAFFTFQYFDILYLPYLTFKFTPLYTVQRDVRSHLMVEEYTMNPNVIYVEPEYGNHFGFFEGGIFEIFSNKTSYTYPAKLALEFFNIILDEKVKAENYDRSK